MNVSALQLSGVVVLVLFGGATIGQFPGKRRTLQGIAFGQWRERRMFLIVAIGLIVFFLPELMRHGSSLLTDIFR